MYFLPAIVLSLLFGIFAPGDANAYIWRCHTAQGDIWTEPPTPNADCQEFDGTYNPGAAPPPVQSAPQYSQQYPQPQYPQYSPQVVVPPAVVMPPPVVYAPYPYAYPPYY